MGEGPNPYTHILSHSPSTEPIKSPKNKHNPRLEILLLPSPHPFPMPFYLFPQLDLYLYALPINLCHSTKRTHPSLHTREKTKIEDGPRTHALPHEPLRGPFPRTRKEELTHS